MNTHDKTKQVSRKELLQLAFFKLVKQGNEKAALSLSFKLINQEHSGTNYIRFGGSENELDALIIIDQFLEGTTLGNMSDLTRFGHYMFNLKGEGVTINVENYEKS